MNSWDKFGLSSEDFKNEYSNPYKKKETSLKSLDFSSSLPVDEEAVAKICNFINSINKIYTSPKLRVDETAWRDLLNDPMVENMEYGNVFKKEVLYYFTKHYYLPDNVWDLIDVLFCFSTDYSQESDDYSYSIMLYSLINNLDNLSPLSYQFITNIEPDLFDIYLSYREIIYRDLKCGNFKDASINLDLAYDICDYDPELIRLNGDYFYLTKSYEDAASLYKKSLKLNENDDTALERLGKCYYKLSDYKNAIPYLLSYVNKYPKKYNMVLLLGLCYYRTYDFSNAKIYFDILFTNTLKYRCLSSYTKSINKRMKRTGKLVEDDFDYTLPIEESPKFKYFYPDGYVTTKSKSAFYVSNIALILLFGIAFVSLLIFCVAFTMTF